MDKKDFSQPFPTQDQLVGECLDGTHPDLPGRALIQWVDFEHHKKWLPTLKGLTLEKSDTVLLSFPHNWSEPLVVGVINRHTRELKSERFSNLTRKVEDDETVRFEGADGSPLLEIHPGVNGPVVKLLDNDVKLDLKVKIQSETQSKK